MAKDVESISECRSTTFNRILTIFQVNKSCGSGDRRWEGWREYGRVGQKADAFTIFRFPLLDPILMWVPLLGSWCAINNNTDYGGESGP